MRRTIALLFLVIAPLTGWSSGPVTLMEAKVNLHDKASLQRGARLFVNYCLSCHSAQFMRYNRMAADLGIEEDLLKKNLMFASQKPGDTMTVALDSKQAMKWFGTPPPDLSVVTRSRGPDWIYTFLLSFYEDDDPSRQFGVNNVVFPATAMPAVLSGLQGVQILTEHKPEGHGEEGHGTAAGPVLELKSEGSMNPAQYRKAVRDLVNFLTYVGEPAQLVRYDIGIWVLLFLAAFYVLTRALYKEYWKDVH